MKIDIEGGEALMEQYYIVSLNDNYADEFDIESFSLFTSTEKELYEKALSILEHGDSEFYYGTNEYYIFSSEEIKKNLKFETITEEEYKTIKKLIGENFGIMSPKSLIINSLECTIENSKEDTSLLVKLYEQLNTLLWK